MQGRATDREQVLDSIVDDFLRHHTRGRTVLVIDGIDGAGKTRFADVLGARFAARDRAVYRATIDGFHRPRVERHARGRDSPHGFYRDSYDYGVFQRALVEPFRLGAEFVTAAFDVAQDTPVEVLPQIAPTEATLIVDGIFLNRPELRGLWNYSVWLDVPRHIAEARMCHRDGATAHTARYAGGQQLYLAEARPRDAASVIIDNTDFVNPRRVFADSC